MWRDNIRQGVIDMSVLASSLGNFDLDGDGASDLRPFGVGYTGISWGSINGTVYAGLEPLVGASFLSVPGAGGARSANASEFFGPRVRAGLEAQGILPGDPLFELYFTLGQTVIDPADPINWIEKAVMEKPVMVHEVIGDTVVPNLVPDTFLAGTEQLIRVGGLQAYDSTLLDPEGLRAAARFVPPATHGSLLVPSGSLAATIEMQGQMASFLGSSGTLIQVSASDTMRPVVVPFRAEISDRSDDFEFEKPINKPVLQPVPGPVRRGTLD